MKCGKQLGNSYAATSIKRHNRVIFYNYQYTANTLCYPSDEYHLEVNSTCWTQSSSRV